jgi:hypothetical protein
VALTVLCGCVLQQSHEVLMSLYKDLQDGTFTPNATSSSWKTNKEKEKQLIDSLLQSFSKTSWSFLKSKARTLAKRLIHIS